MRFEGKCTSVPSYRSWDAYRAWILHRSGFDDDTEGEGEGSEVGMMSPIIRRNTWAPDSQLHVGRAFSRRVYENQPRTPSPPVSVSRLNYTGSAYYPPLNYSLLTAKIAPCHPYFSSHGISRSISSPFSYTVSLWSSSRPHRRYIPTVVRAMVTFVFRNLFYCVPLIHCGYGKRWLGIIVWWKNRGIILFSGICWLMCLKLAYNYSVILSNKIFFLNFLYILLSLYISI